MKNKILEIIIFILMLIIMVILITLTKLDTTKHIQYRGTLGLARIYVRMALRDGWHKGVIISTANQIYEELYYK